MAMKIELLDHTINPVETIGRMSAVCYDSDTSQDACVRRAKGCKDKGHLATMRFAYATFNVSGISRACSHQLVRMAHAGILQRSQRYVKESMVQFIRPSALDDMPEGVKSLWEEILRKSKDCYAEAIECGMKKEDARYILPQSCTTELNLCLNFQSWQDFLNNRTDKAAQWEIRDVAVEIERQLHELAPEVF